MAESLDVDIDCLTFLHTVDSRKLHNSDILWTPVHKFDPPTDYRVRGRVKLENGQWTIQLIPLPIQDWKQLVCPVGFTWTLSVVKGRKSQLQDSRVVPWEKIKKVFGNAHIDYDVIDSITVSQKDIKICQMEEVDGTVTFMWYVELFLDNSLTSEVRAEKEAQRNQIEVQRSDISKQERESGHKILFGGFDTEVKQTVSIVGSEKEGGDSFQNEMGNSSTLFTSNQEVDIVLIGKIGHGKSSTGNSILRRNEFKTSSKGTSVTKDIQVAWTNLDNFTIKVVDGPGVEDNCSESAETTQKACEDIVKALTTCPTGVHALLLVFKFRQKFTREEEDCITLLKSILGPNILRDYCVIVITHGELFDMDEHNKDFSVWLSSQESALKNLLNECSYRCVLMQNRTKDEKIKKTQLRQLMQTILSVKYRDVRCNKEAFDRVQREREYEDKIEELNRILSQTMENAKKEEEQRWQNILDKVEKDHDQQMTMLQSQYQSMKTMDDEIMKFMKSLSGQLRRLQGTQPPSKDPNQVTLRCTDQDGRTVSVPLPKTSPIKPVIDAYCNMTGCLYDKLKFQLGGVEVRPEQTPSDLQVVDGVTIEVSYNAI